MSVSNVQKIPDMTVQFESEWHYVEGFPSAYYRVFQGAIKNEIASVDDIRDDDELVRALLTQLNLGSISHDRINGFVRKLDQVDIMKIERRLRLKVAYSLLFPIVFPAPEVQIQNYFSDQHILKWVMSVVPESSAVMVLENFRVSETLPAIQPIVDSEETWRPNHRLLFVAEVLIRGEFKHLGVSFSESYVAGKNRESILAEMRQIFGPLYRKELYLVTG